jgi:hypothetical protein
MKKMSRLPVLQADKLLRDGLKYKQNFSSEPFVMAALPQRRYDWRAFGMLDREPCL